MMVFKVNGIYLYPLTIIKNLFWGMGRWYKRKIHKPSRVGWKVCYKAVIMNDDFIYRVG